MLSSYVQFLQIYSDNKLTLWLIIVFLFEAHTDSSDSIEELVSPVSSLLPS